jgi:uncharacterized protein (TIGR02099 family)
MKRLLSRIIKFCAYFGGGIIVLLAIAVGLFRLFLPRLPEYQDEIKEWASTAIGLHVEFSGMDARWGLSGPEVEFFDAELVAPDTLARIVAADTVSVGVALSNLLFDRKAVVDRVVVRETDLEVRQLPDGTWAVQGSPIDELIPVRNRPADDTGGAGIGPIEVRLEDIRLNLLQPGDERPKYFQIPLLTINRDEVRMAIDATVQLPEDLGDNLSVSAIQLLRGAAEDRIWDIRARAEGVRLKNVSVMQPFEEAWFESGRGDLDVSLRVAGQRVQSATADLAFRNISIASLSEIALSGRFEYFGDDNGLLVAASDFQAVTAQGEWPPSTLRFEIGTDDEDNIVMLDVEASYLNLADAAIALPWLNEERRSMFSDFDPSGVVRDLDLSVSELDSETPRFTVSGEFEDIGVAASSTRPGVRGFSGRVRADESSGRLEIFSDDLVVTAPKFLSKPLSFDETSGTVIWRHGQDRTTVLSDSIILRNEFLDSETGVEVSLIEGQERPVIDLESVFSITDAAAGASYVPYMEKRARMSEWFQTGILAGRVPRATARLYGPLDAWPFDNGEGQLLIESAIRDAVIVYDPEWPAVEIAEAELIIENQSLRSTRNAATTAGNVVRNARIEIADFRNPFLVIKVPADGTMESFQRLTLESPINELLGRQLEKLTVSGAARVDLDLNMPIRDAKNFTFLANLQVDDGSVQMEGFSAPVTGIEGAILIERDRVGSEALTGTFLGNPLAVKLSQAPESMPQFKVIADATGRASASALRDELGLPLSGRVRGATDFSARLLFPDSKVEQPSPFTIQLASDLEDLEIAVPRPLGKTADQRVDVGAAILLPKGSERIETSGRAGDIFSWRVALNKQDGAWDIDRGIANFGIDATADDDAGEPLPDLRGLHLRGSTDYIHVRRWFEMARSSESNLGMMDWIRSVELDVTNLHLLGQHLVDHRIRVDRSARDWHVEVEGEDIVASTDIPYDFNSGRPIVVEAQRLILPGDDTEPNVEPTRIDPRVLPPISITSEETAFGARYFGAIEANFLRTANGLESETIVAKDPTFEIIGNASWIFDESDPAGSRSLVTASLSSTDVKETMQRLGYEPGIESDDLSMLLDLSWSGGPSETLLETLDGDVKVRIGEGELEEVDPGAGRVFGLLSVAALPRRLALDFRDVFGKGFVFDKIRGNFTLVDGNTFTCDLSLESPAADIGIVGRAGLASRDYEQTAVISASFGNALPVAGALVAGPQVAAALLIFSQIFKKPLQEATQVYYAIGGTFDEPVIESTTPEIFALSGAMAGCIEEDDS